MCVVVSVCVCVCRGKPSRMTHPGLPCCIGAQLHGPGCQAAAVCRGACGSPKTSVIAIPSTLPPRDPSRFSSRCAGTLVNAHPRCIPAVCLYGTILIAHADNMHRVPVTRLVDLSRSHQLSMAHCAWWGLVAIAPPRLVGHTDGEHSTLMCAFNMSHVLFLQAQHRRYREPCNCLRLADK